MGGKIGPALVKGLGINTNIFKPTVHDDLIQHGTNAVLPFEGFVEEPPTTKAWILEKVPKRKAILPYFASFFPFLKWICRYNWRWFFADIVAGCTLSLVVIPQGLSYGTLANLSPEYGLYTTFAGASLYWIFGTSKDIAVGATSVISLLVGKAVTNVTDKHPNYTQEEVAKTHAFLTGCILLILGLLRLGWIIELIPHVATSAFVTASAIIITLGQVPALLGIHDINTRGAAYRVFIDICKGLSGVRIDAAVGLTALALLISIKWLCGYMMTRQPRWAKRWSTISSLRLCFTVLLYILISFLVNRNNPSGDYKFRILGRIPVGFNHTGLPILERELLNALLPELPTAAIIVIVEHIAIGKSYGQKNDYSIYPSQELISIAATNIAGPFIGAYTSTASFGGGAVLSSAGVRTPFAGVINAVILLITLYALHRVLFWIPTACLAAVIIQSVISLIKPPVYIVKLWMISPPDAVIYFAGVLTSIFSSLENGIYVTAALSASLLLVRLARAHGRFLGRVNVYRYPRPGGERCVAVSNSSLIPAVPTSLQETNISSRNVFFPLDRNDASNPSIHVESLCPGIFVYRFPEGLSYINQAQHMDSLQEHITKETSRTTVLHYENPGDRPWNEPDPSMTHKSSNQPDPETTKPTLKAIILDFSTVNSIDTGALEGLANLRDQLRRWSLPNPVEWHFANVGNPWVRRALAAEGFGYPSKEDLECNKSWNPTFSIAKRSSLQTTDSSLQEEATSEDTGALGGTENVGRRYTDIRVTGWETGGMASTHGVNYPYFHVDLVDAVESISGISIS